MHAENYIKTGFEPKIQFIPKDLSQNIWNLRFTVAATKASRSTELLNPTKYTFLQEYSQISV